MVTLVWLGEEKGRVDKSVFPLQVLASHPDHAIYSPARAAMAHVQPKVGWLFLRGSFSVPSIRNLIWMTYPHAPPSGNLTRRKCTRTLKNRYLPVLCSGWFKKFCLFTFSIFPTTSIYVTRKFPVNLIYLGRGIKSQFLKNCGKQFDVCLFKHFGSTGGVAMGMVRFTLYREWFHLAPQAPWAKLGSPTHSRVSH